MILLALVSLGIIIYHICRQLDTPLLPTAPLSGNCPGCAHHVEAGWLVCPHCRTVLRQTCQECSRVHDQWVKFCPWCGQANRGNHHD